MQTIVLGGGCFWCIEAVFSDVKGVESAVSGYAGGELKDPTYEQVSTGRTGHAEVVEITFDEAVIPLRDILTMFFTLHDPTTRDRQGADIGSEYRSIILYATEAQKEVAQAVMEEIADAGIWEDPIVTELVPLAAFYEAESYHQEYFKKNRGAGYCRIVIEPKVAKLRASFADRPKENSR